MDKLNNQINNLKEQENKLEEKYLSTSRNKVNLKEKYDIKIKN